MGGTPSFVSAFVIRIFRFLLLLIPYLLLAGAGAAYWSRTTYYSEIFSAWLPLWLALSILLTGYLICTMRTLALLVALAGTFLMAMWVVEANDSPGFAPPMVVDSLRHATIAQWNPKGDIGFIEWLNHLPPEIDLVVANEVGNAVWRQSAVAGARFPFKMADGEAQTVLLSRQPLQNPTPVILPGNPNPMLRADVTLSGRRMRIFALAATAPSDAQHWRQRDVELAHAAPAIAESPYPAILIGSLNISPYARIFPRFLAEAHLSSQTPAHAMPGSWPSYLLVPPLQIASDHFLVGEGIKIQHRGRTMPCCSSHVAMYTRIGF